jgi:LPXTG-motif cell wall-anchored protein
MFAVNWNFLWLAGLIALAGAAALLGRSRRRRRRFRP